jgi:hypothetical protein
VAGEIRTALKNVKGDAEEPRLKETPMRSERDNSWGRGGASEALHEGGKQATKPGKHGTLRLWRITYKDTDNPAFGENSYQRWAYDKDGAWDDFNEEVNSAGESWEIVKIESVLDTGPKRLSREARSEVGGAMFPRGAREAPKMSGAQQWQDRILRNADDYAAGRISWDVWSARQSEMWEKIRAKGRRLVSQVLNLQFETGYNYSPPYPGSGVSEARRSGGRGRPPKRQYASPVSYTPQQLAWFDIADIVRDLESTKRDYPDWAEQPNWAKYIADLERSAAKKKAAFLATYGVAFEDWSAYPPGEGDVSETRRRSARRPPERAPGARRRAGPR